MTFTDVNLFAIFLSPLESAGLDYMVSGSVAAMNYGEPRLTNDIDLVLALTPASLARLEEEFPETHFYRAPSEVLLMELGRAHRGHTNLIHHETGFRADVYFRANDPLHAWAWPRRRRFEVADDLEAWFAPPEYVILRKLEYYKEGGSEKHLSDIRSILDQSEFSHLASSPEIAEWAERLGVTDHWEKSQEQ